MPPYETALKGSREIGFAVLAMTLTLAAVFAPLAFAEGNTGKLFTEFALTVAGAVLVSDFVALTLTPMMASRILRHEPRHNALFNFGERVLTGLNSAYTRGVTRVLRHPWIVTLVFVLVAAAAFGLLKSLKSELAPTEDRGFFIGVMVAPEGATLQYTDQYARQLEGIYQSVPEVDTAFMVVAPGLERPNPVNSALSFVMLKPWEERARSQMAITEGLGPQMFMGMPGVLAFPINPPSLGQSFRNPPLQFVVQAPSYTELDQAVEALMEKVRAYPGLSNADSDLKLNKPQLRVDINRDKAAQMCVGIDTIGRTLETLLGGRDVTRFKQVGEQYDVILQLDPAARATPQDLSALYVRGREGSLTPLSNLVTVTETVAPKELNHYDRQRAAIISANIAPGYTLSDALTFMLALIVIYLVLAAQFESFISPFIIMHRRATGAETHRRHVQRLQPDRAGDAGWPDHQARHPDCGIRQPVAPPRQNPGRSGDRGRQPAFKAHPDDHRRNGTRRSKNDDLSDHFDEASSKWSRLTVILLSNEPDLMRVSTPSGVNGDWHEPCSYPCTSPARRNRYDRTRTRKIAGYQPEGRCRRSRSRHCGAPGRGV